MKTRSRSSRPGFHFSSEPMVKRLLQLGLPLPVSAVGLGVISGGLMNAINASISPAYFQLFFYIHPFAGARASADVIGPAMMQGVVEGSAYGLAIGIIFSLLVFGVSRGQCSYSAAVTYILKMLTLVWVFWIAGGINGLIIVKVFPQTAGNASLLGIYPLAFFWVGGSIWGSYIGCITGLIFGCSWFARDWKRGKLTQR